MSFNLIILLMLLSTNISSGKHTDYEKSILDAISGLNRNLHNDINKKHFVRSGNGCLFVKFDGYALYGHNDKTMLDLSLEECKDMCQYQIHWECQSIDYIETDRMCTLSRDSHLTHPDAFGEHWSNTYYYKVCQNGESLPNNDPCPEDYFKCEDNGVCIDQSHVCDGEELCFDGSDESQCDGAESNNDIPDEISNEVLYDDDVCHSNFNCPNTDICILQSYKCDHECDCPQCEDEAECIYKPCDKNIQFTCAKDKRCIPIAWKCDGYSDCLDSSDEKHC